MSEKDKLLNQNKKGEMIWYTHRWKEVVSRCEVYGFSKEDIIRKYGSVKEFEKIETEHNKSVIETFKQLDWMGEGLEPNYILNFDSGWGNWNEYEDYECLDGFHIYDGIDGEWMNDKYTKQKIEDKSMYDNDKEFKQLGLDLGIREDER